jgi:hypothetical protein
LFPAVVLFLESELPSIVPARRLVLAVSYEVLCASIVVVLVEYTSYACV